MSFVKRTATLLRLAGNAALGGGVVGVIINIYGVIGLVADAKGDPWMWIAVGSALLALSFLSVAYQVLAGKERAEEETESRTQVKAGVFGEGRDGGTGIRGPVHGEYHEH